MSKGRAIDAPNRPATLPHTWKGAAIPANDGLTGIGHPNDTSHPNDKVDDDDYPAYNMGTAAQILGTTPAFLRSLDEARLLTPKRPGGGHRRYSRSQLRIAARVRELIDQGTALDAACRIIILEDRLTKANAVNTELHRDLDDLRSPAGDDPSGA